MTRVAPGPGVSRLPGSRGLACLPAVVPRDGRTSHALAHSVETVEVCREVCWLDQGTPALVDALYADVFPRDAWRSRFCQDFPGFRPALLRNNFALFAGLVTACSSPGTWSEQGARGDLRQAGGGFMPPLTPHGVPKRSVTIPNDSAQKVSPSGIVTLPPSASAAKMRRPSSAVG